VAVPSDGASVDVGLKAPAVSGRDVATGVGTAGLVVACFARFGFEPEAFIGAAFAVVLVALAVIDLERRIIPNRIVLPAAAIVLAARLVFFSDQTLVWIAAGIGAALFFFLPLLVYPSGMGMGDVKLAFLLGVGLGGAVVTALVVGLVAACIVALAILVRGGRAARKQAIPFGPFLALGGLVALFFT
jgi:leader peptidase (prepilin peptidase) / N-methyltransferase